MKEMSVFDVIGPNMIGPSSSHTAGALRIALLASKLAKAKITKVHFVLYGSFAKTYKGHGTDRALLGGILGFNTEDSRIKESFLYADQAGLQYSFELNEIEKDVHPNTVDITITAEDGSTFCVRGVSTGGGNCKIVKIDQIEVAFTGEYVTLLIRQRDIFGVVAYITSCLSEYRVNIAFMRLYRENKGEAAYTIIETDNDISAELLRKIEQCKDITSAMVIKM